jgi:hypothetical protein
MNSDFLHMSGGVRESYIKMVYCIKQCGKGGTEMFGSPKFACRNSAFVHRTYTFQGRENTYFTSYIVEFQSKWQRFSDYQKFFFKAYTSATKFHY